MEFTIQDKIDIYHVILGMIEAGVQTWTEEVYQEPGYNPNRLGVCKELRMAKLRVGLFSPSGYAVFPEWWYKFQPDPDDNPHHPYWWGEGKTGDRQRCRHIRKVLRSLYKQLP